MSGDEEFGDKPRTGDLFADLPAGAREVAGDWPPADRFPLNVAGRSVRRRVVADLADADSPLIVTGYAGLEQLIRLEGDLGEARHLRILFGNEPSAGEGGCRSLHPPSLPEEV